MVQRVLVVDCDVHQGNGTAAIFAHEPRVATFDMYADANWPWQSRAPADVEVALADGTRDEEYLASLREALPMLFRDYDPQLVIFQAGVDALDQDSMGRLSLTRGGLLQRNNLVYSACIDARAALVVCMGGGYARPIGPSVEAHADVYRALALRYEVGALARACIHACVGACCAIRVRPADACPAGEGRRAGIRGECALAEVMRAPQTHQHSHARL